MERIAAYVTLSYGIRRMLIAFAAGAFSVLALPPFGFFIIDFITFPILLWLLDGAAGDPERGWIRRLIPSFVVGWMFGFGYFVAGLWWLGNALMVEADQFAWALPLAILGLPAFLAVYYGLATLLARLFWSDGIARVLALGASFGLAEWLRAILFSGFSWNSMGYAMMPFPLMMQSLAVVGSYAMNTLAVIVFAAPALIATGRGARSGIVLALLLLAAHFGFGYWHLNFVERPTPSETRTVRLVQPVIDQAAKIDDRERQRIFEEHLTLTTAPTKDGSKRPDYVVWPETSIPFILTQNPDALVRIADALEDGQILIAGAVRTESDGTGVAPRYYNSVYMIDSQGQIIGAADKVHLVPFGEYLPFEDLVAKSGLVAIAAMPGGYSSASRHQILTTPDGLKILPLICYEVIFPYEASVEAEASDIIVNLTNDGWFGYSPGPWQHFHQARLRAVETGLPVIRNSNSGISAIINGNGEIISGLNFQAVGYIDAILPAKTVPILNNASRDLNFGLLQVILFLIVVLARMSFIFNRN